MNVPLIIILVPLAGAAQDMAMLVPAGAVAGVLAFWQLTRQIKDTNGDPDDAGRTAAQNAAQQLRAFGGAPASAVAPAVALASHGGAAKTCEERKLLALETIAEVARLWIVSEPN
ncbi:hypothetical protein MAJ_07434, partial [Metarhizium majus ARSEF 297]